MALPLILLGAGLVGAAVAAGEANKKNRMADQLRLLHEDGEPHLDGDEGVAKLPSEVLTSNFSCQPVPGAVVCCSVFSAFDHTGVWIDDNLIVELHGTGLIKGVTPKRFLQNRSGNQMFVACDSKGNPLVVEGSAERSAEHIFDYRDYDLVKNNCYRFTWYCVSGEDKKVTRFSQFNQLLAQKHGKKVYWDKLAFI